MLRPRANLKCLAWPAIAQRSHYSVESLMPQRAAYGFAKLRADDVAAFRNAIRGAGGVLLASDGVDLQAFNRDWFGEHVGAAECVLRPRTVDELSTILSHCHARRLAVVPQGGNTGLVTGSVPIHDEVVVSTSRMDQILSLDPLSGVVVVEAGVVLQHLEEWLQPHGLAVPLDLGARGSCQLGGNASTAAGGARFMRFGSFRSRICGLEVVTADGTVLPMLTTMRKDNTGFDLKQLFIGAEGTLGVITKLAIECQPAFAHVNSSIVACPSFAAVLEVYQQARRTLGEVLSAIEFLDRPSIDIVLQALPSNRDPLPPHRGAEPSQFFVIIETGGANGDHDDAKLHMFLQQVMDSGAVTDGTVAKDSKQAASFWSIRDNVSVAMNELGDLLLYDVSLPQSHCYELVENLRGRVATELPHAVTVGFGHLGDGNLHLNVLTPKQSDGTDLCAARRAKQLVEPFLFERVAALGGSISAEHGLGTKRKQYIGLAKSPAVVAAMQAIKQHFDPHSILNPYKLLPAPGR